MDNHNLTSMPVSKLRNRRSRHSGGIITAQDIVVAASQPFAEPSANDCEKCKFYEAVSEAVSFDKNSGKLCAKCLEWFGTLKK